MIRGGRRGEVISENNKSVVPSEEVILLFHDVSPYHIETSPLFCIANQWTGFYMIRTSVMKESKKPEKTRRFVSGEYYGPYQISAMALFFFRNTLLTAKRV